MKLAWLFLALVLSAWSMPARAAEPVEVYGFAFGTADSSVSEVNSHLRVALRAQLEKDVTVNLVFTPHGPLEVLTYGHVVWRKPIDGVDAVVAGRMLPPFGRTWYDWRVDRVPTVFYSGINWPLSMRDTGVMVQGSGGRVKWYAGAYVGDTYFGNDRSQAMYLRAEYKVLGSIVLGGSQRLSHVPATGADVTLRLGRAEIIGELISSQGVTQELLLGQYQVSKRVGVALQHEWLDAGSRWTAMSTVYLGRSLELKAGYLLGENQKGRIVGQLVTRW